MIGAMTEGYAAELRMSEVAPRAACDADAVLRGLVEDHFDFVWRSVRRVGFGPADADDITQEAFLVASRRLGDLQAGRERSFLLATAMRVASTFRRGERREQARRQARLAPPERRFTHRGVRGEAA